ncbi:hypothetical protein ACFS5N_09880 [Mucilaginibacter ximonensis]|uniref:Carboxypeptidase-like protein n=1 Tax=Mucilaginibacter ximonensis TaxID=538021 RepID=A0ABW5YD91_9SPHI
MNKLKYIATMFFGVLLFGQAGAQDLLKGRVQELKNEVLLPGIKIENSTQHQTVYSDTKGNFVIRAKKGDVLYFTGMSYIPDTVYVADMKYLVVSLVLRQNELKEVSVKNSELRLGKLSATPETGPLGSRTVVYQPNGGLKVKLFDSHSNEKKREKLARLEQESEQYQQIKAVFNEETVKNYIPLSGQELKNFVIKYTPDSKTFFSDKFNMAAYINENYKAFMKIPEEKRKSTTYFQLNGSDN